MMLLPLSSPFTAHSGGRPLPSHRAAHDCCAATASPHAATPHDADSSVVFTTLDECCLLCCEKPTKIYMYFLCRAKFWVSQSVAVVGDSLGFSLGL